jgi:asparagine synthase (glutamine-hydrolysing)
LLPPQLGRNVDGLAGLFDPDPGVRYFWMIRQIADREKDRISGEALRAAHREPASALISRWMHEPSAGSALEDRISFADVIGYLPGDVLTKVDIATMAHGLETRSPLLDHHVLELAASAPPEVRYRSGSLKSLLRRAFADSVPPGHFDRPKRGFAIPIQEWFRGPWEPLLRDVLLTSGARVAAYLNPQAVSASFEEHRSRRISRGYQLWSLLMLELWHREVVER